MAYDLDEFTATCRAALAGGKTAAALETIRLALERLLANAAFVERHLGPRAEIARHLGP